MKNIPAVASRREAIIMFVWQHLLLLVSLFVMTLGVALCVRSNMGSSVISTIPFIMSIGGSRGKCPDLTIGEYTYIMNFVLVMLQILVLRRQFEPMQLFQLLIGFVFGFLLDFNMWFTSSVVCTGVISGIIVQILGCIVLASGIPLELRCGSVTMPGEGLPVALSRAFGIPFPKAKIGVDISLVVIAVTISFIFFGQWLWSVVGIGTLMAMVLVGALVKAISPHLDWFDKLLYYRPGFRRYIYGLAHYIYRRNK